MKIKWQTHEWSKKNTECAINEINECIAYTRIKKESRRQQIHILEYLQHLWNVLLSPMLLSYLNAATTYVYGCMVFGLIFILIIIFVHSFYFITKSYAMCATSTATTTKISEETWLCNNMTPNFVFLLANNSQLV